MKMIHLDAFDLGIAAILVLLNAGISIYLGLRLHRQVLWAAFRMVVQLLLVGWLLRIVFAASSPWITIAVIALMITAAAREVAVRPARRLKGWQAFHLSAAVVSVTGIGTVLLALLTAIRPTPWYDPHYAIPLMGIVLGSILNSASLGLDVFFSGISGARAAIEGRLALGATSREALMPHIRNAIRSGLIPIVNQMSAAGIITLPGIMTGQLLAGMDPIDAVKYQILLMFLLTGGSALAACGAVYMAAAAISDKRHRLRLDRLANRLK
ncbi:MAG TPA: iron export ABC transporter permease subunit FetB [Herbaspirillum sp.]|jgi:putative ABC transport system permease protein|nr:iron export ABC transporter permease subunit FetB [Herbaspirillum sp.]